jgi:hypothetical protein
LDILHDANCPEAYLDGSFIEFWQTERDDNPKGIIRIGLRHEANDQERTAIQNHKSQTRKMAEDSRSGKDTSAAWNSRVGSLMNQG